MTTRTAPPAPSLRRRADAMLLRWQGRLDTDWADRVVPWLVAAGLFVVLALASLARIRSVSASPELAVYTQAVWLLSEGRDPAVTVGDGLNVFGGQAAFVLWPLSLLWSLVPGPGVLLAVQSAALAVGVVPIWLICRRLAGLRPGTTFVAVLAYALFPPLHTINLGGFHPEALALPALLFGAYYGLSKHWRRFGACCVLVVLCRADLGLAVAALGFIVHRKGRRVEGWVAMVGGTVWWLLAITVIEPRFTGGVYAHADAYAMFGDSPGSVVTGMLSHPAAVVGNVLREENFDLAARLFAPLVFLPLLAPRFLLPLIPLEVVYLTGDAPREVVESEHAVPLVAFLFVALAFALARIGRRGTDRVTVDQRVLVVLLIASLVSFARDAPMSPYRQPWTWGSRDAADAARLIAVRDVPAEASVRASPTLLVDLARRPVVLRLDHRDLDPAVVGAGVDTVIIDESTLPDVAHEERRRLREGLEARGFEVTFDAEGIIVFAARAQAGPPD